MLEEKWHITDIQIQTNISTNILQNNIKVKNTTVFVSRNGVFLRALSKLSEASNKPRQIPSPRAWVC